MIDIGGGYPRRRPVPDPSGCEAWLFLVVVAVFVLSILCCCGVF